MSLFKYLSRFYLPHFKNCYSSYIQFVMMTMVVMSLETGGKSTMSHLARLFKVLAVVIEIQSVIGQTFIECIPCATILRSL